MKKGFTLVELLAVIVILAIILAIAIPGISNIIDSSKKGAAENDVKMIIKAIDLKKIEEDGFNPTTVTEETIEEKLGISANNYERITVKEMNGQLYVTMVGKDKWKGITVSGTKTNTRADETIATPEEKPNAPELATGMIPIKWVTDHWVTTTKDDPEWYEYGITPETRRWANAITRDCEIVNGIPTNIETCSMWVWIPRYVYKISAGWHGDGLLAGQAGTIDIQFSKGVDDSWNGPIDLREGAYASKSTGSNNNGDKYTNHPAFTFGDTELTGFWIAKFEASSTDPSANSGGGNVTNLKVRSVPNTIEWRYITWNNAWTVMRNMETDNFYGWGTDSKNIDTHMFKNVEWGAVAYLAQSVYGKNSEVWRNPSINSTGTADAITGRSGNTVNQANTSDPFGNPSNTLYGYDGRACSSKTGYVCTGARHETNGMAASTTGNIYGVYDMNGGSLEYAAAYLENAPTTMPIVGNLIFDAPAKYKDIYPIGNPQNRVNNYDASKARKGDAIYETSSGDFGTTAWYGDESFMPYDNFSAFQRGGYYLEEAETGLFYYYLFGSGGYGNWYGFRPVLLVGQGL